MDMELYVTKHRMLQDFLAKIGELLKKPVDKRTAEAISDEINKMTGVLNMHLASEDGFVYPALLQHADAKIRTMTERYMAEMRTLSAAYADFYAEYNTPSKILADTARFQAAFQKIRDALSLRMEREEKELYAFMA